MKSITIHGIDKQLADMIKAKAEAEGLSINKTVKKMLESAFGIRPRPPRKNIDDFREFCGVWSETDVKAFEERTSETRVANPEDWL